MSKTIQYLDLAGLKALYGVVDGKITTAVDGLKGDVSNDYNTLKKIEDKVVAEITRATNAENVNKDAIDAINNATNGILAQSKAYTDSEFTKRTTIASYGITDAVINETAPSIKLGSNELVFTALTTAEIQSAANPNTESES